MSEKLKQIVEAALLAAGRPLSLDQLQALFDAQGGASVAGGRKPAATDAQGGASAAGGRKPGATDAEGGANAAEGGKPDASDENSALPDKRTLREVLGELAEEYTGRGIEVVEVGSGFRIQVRSEYSPWVSRLYAERPPKYSRALLETLALIAYRQPITRGEIEDIRGVSVSSNIIKTLTEREWVRVVGHRDVPGKPALYATTKEFLDYFNLKSLSELPTLAEIRDLESINRELELKDPDAVEPPKPKEAANAPELEALEDEPMTGADADGETGYSPAEPVETEATTEAPKVEAGELEKVVDFDPDGETDSLTTDSDFSEADERTPREDS